MDAWVGLLAYTLQLYFDFSGYSDMAIGTSLMFNVRLPDNFDAPYRATSITDFWRRWHMTLSRFLRDYLYIPLGGNRGGEAKRNRNLILTMTLGGLWHGANWTFIAWGVFHGILLVVHRLWASINRPLPAWSARALTFVAVMIGWCFFRSGNMGACGSYLVSLTGANGIRSAATSQFTSPLTLGFLAFALVLANFAPTTKQWVESRRLGFWHGVILALVFLGCLLVIRDVQMGSGKSEFIYFQF
jgi:D-alanyl-lipoteichoic acid acyltransferase DltB (MBOAT superfamily)